MATSKQRWRSVRLTLAGAFTAYCACYLYYTRVGYYEQDVHNAPAFYLSSPYGSGDYRMHVARSILFRPLLKLESELNQDRILAGSWPLTIHK